MRDHSSHIEISRDEAAGALLEASGFIKTLETTGIPADRKERIQLKQAMGRVLAEDVIARVDLPNTRICCMDSVAVHWTDFEEGVTPDVTDWKRGINWEFANTGIAMPEGFDTAIVIEHIELDEDENIIGIKALPSCQFAGTSEPGSRVKTGTVLAKKGSVITPDLAAVIAGGNEFLVTVVKKPRVAFLPTGNELVVIGSDCTIPGKNPETNSILLETKVDAWGGECLTFPIIPDNYEALKAAIKEAGEASDIIVLNAGSSKGSEDWSVEVLEELGTVLYHQVMHGPSHHCFAGVVDGKVVCGISGPPAGASFAMDFYLRPLLMAWLGLDPKPVTIKARLAKDFEKKPYDHVGKITGETRPYESHPNNSFARVKPMLLMLSPEGVVEAHPLPGRPGSRAAFHANALYLLMARPDGVNPQVGDVIDCELREPTLLANVKPYVADTE